MSVVMTTASARELRNADVFKREFRRTADAAIAIILVRTREMERCRAVLQDIAIETEAEFKLWACNQGWMSFPKVGLSDPLRDTTDISKPVSAKAETIEIVRAFQEVKDGIEDDVIYVMYHPHHHFEKGIIQQYLMDILAKGRERGIRLVMLCPESVKIPSEIEDYVHIMDFYPPSHAELVAGYNELVASIQPGMRPNFTDEQISLIVQNGLGMTQLEFECALSLALVELAGGKGQGGSSGTVEEYCRIILRHKTEAIKKTDLLELMPGENMGNVGGLDLLKAWLQTRSRAYDEKARDYGIRAPRGCLVVGPPGGGKSLFARSVSSVFNAPLAKLDIGKIFGKFVGESEGRMRSAIKVIESMAPCVLLIDEIDKGFGGLQGGGTDGGASMRVLGSFLNWMQDRDNETKPVFVVMTANNVVGLPPELMRRGRIDEIFAVSFPSLKEREEILNIHLTKRGHKLPKAEIAKVAAQTDKFVGAELEGIVENSLLDAFAKNLPHPTAEMMIGHAKDMVPLHKAFADKVNFMHEWAKNNAKAASSGMTFDAVPTEKPASGLRRNVRLGGIKPRNQLDG